MEPLTTDGYMAFPPTRLIVLSNYRVMTQLLSKLNEAARTLFKSLCRYAMIDGSIAPAGHPVMRVAIVDAHFHMDMLSSRYLAPKLGLKSSMTPIARLVYAIANYVYPRQ